MLHCEKKMDMSNLSTQKRDKNAHLLTGMTVVRESLAFDMIQPPHRIVTESEKTWPERKEPNARYQTSRGTGLEDLMMRS